MMKSVLLLIERDAKNLHERIVVRKREYLHEFSLKRTRDHFVQIFHSIYPSAKLEDLKDLSEELIFALDDFYSKVEKMQWYLMHTQDMPQAVSDKVDGLVKEIQSSYDRLSLYLQGELGGLKRE